MSDSDAFARVKKTVRPSGVNAGDRSFAGPEITPGENTVGLRVLRRRRRAAHRAECEGRARHTKCYRGCRLLVRHVVMTGSYW